MFALDTNTLIYYFKKIGNVTANLLQVSPKDIFVPSIVVYELEFGIAKSISPQKRIEQLSVFLTAVNILPFDTAEAKIAALIRADLEKQGQPIGYYDVLIAATAMTHHKTLVTHNTKEFSRIKGLQLTDWYG